MFSAIGRDIFDVSLREEMFLLLPAGAGFALGVALAGFWVKSPGDATCWPLPLSLPRRLPGAAAVGYAGD